MSTSPETGGFSARQSRAVWTLGLVAAALRLGYVLAMRRHALSWGDEFTYDQLAGNLLQGHGFCFVPGQPSLLRAPLYAGFLAGMYALFGHRFLPVFLLQALLGGLSVPLLARIGTRVSGDFRLGMIAGGLLALNPLFIFACNLLYTETLHILLLLLMVTLWQTMFEQFAKGGHNSWVGPAVGSGLLLGLNNLLRPNMTLFPLCLLLCALLSGRGGRRAVAPALLVMATMLLPVLPWTVRNHEVSGRWVLVSANSGLVLAEGNNSQVQTGAGLNPDFMHPTPGLSEADQDRAYWRRGQQWIISHPGRFAELALLKLGAFFSPSETTNRGPLMSRLAPLLYAVCAAYYGLALAGWIVTRRRWRAWLLMDLLIAYPALLTIIFYGGTRYGMPAQPFVMLYCACGLLWLARHHSFCLRALR